MTDPRLFIPAPKEPALLQKLRQAGLVISESGKEVRVQCPVCKHEALYCLPSQGNEVFGSYTCSGHCSCDSIFELLKHLELTEADALVLPKVFLRAGETATVIEILAKELQTTDVFFQYGGGLSKIEPRHDEAIVTNMTEASLFLELARRFRFFKFDARSKRNMPVDVPERILSTMLRAKVSDFPRVISLTHQPTMGLRGEVCFKPGYNPQSQLYGAFPFKEFHSLDRKISKEEAESSLAYLQGLVEEIPFDSEVDAIATISAMLTAVFRPSLVAAPFIFVNAFASSSGKTTLCDGLIRLSTLGDIEKIIFHKDDAEFDRTLFSALRKAPGAVYFDNVTVDVRPIASFCTLLTHGQFAGRVIRTSDVETVNVRALMIGNGNSIPILQDMIRRTLVIQLEAVDSSSLRIYNKPSLFEYLIDHRNEVLRHVITIAKAWNDAGRPRVSNPLPSFQEWDACCRAPIIWLTGMDPLSRMLEAFEKLNPSHIHAELLQVLFDIFHESVFSVSDISKRVTDSLLDELQKLGLSSEQVINARKLGYWLLHHAGSNLGRLRLIAVSPNQKIKKYRIEVLSND